MTKKTETKSEPVSFTKNSRIGLLSDVGRKRNVDEDSILVVESIGCFESKIEPKFLLVLADGMGGHSKGELASKITTQTIAEKISPSILSEIDYVSAIADSIKEANRRVLQYTVDNPEAQGMGTTVVCAVIDGNSVHIGHVGDSRAYVINKEGIEQITKDHSYVQDLVDKGEITAKEVRSHPKKNVIMRAVGIYGDVDVDTTKLTLADDEYLLLCCDGQIIHVEDEELQEIVLNAENSQEACQKLIDIANERGGEDNISVILLSPRKN